MWERLNLDGGTRPPRPRYNLSTVYRSESKLYYLRPAYTVRNIASIRAYFDYFRRNQDTPGGLPSPGYKLPVS